jgi:hypothetical protein|tara:strand:- start:170 stop:382 length:213 start_codon:yes stop_codon:yes gene_type:complete
MQLDNGLGLTTEKEKKPVRCKNCDHNCHCKNNGDCAKCDCKDCEHNALDEFYDRLDDYAGALLNLTKHKE